MTNKSIVLASASPRRQELLKLITDDFSIKVSEVDERAIEDEYKTVAPRVLAQKLSHAKAQAVYDGLSKEQKQTAIVIGADTSVIIGSEILGKPEDKQVARRMLTMLSGNTHSVITGVSVIGDFGCEDFSEESLVTFGALDEYQIQLIEDYINTSEPYDKAGAYGIQGGGALLVKKIDGDYFNVMGLPVFSLARMLDELGIKRRFDA